MGQIDYNDIPSGYPHCIVSDCPVAAHCLHQRAMQLLNDKEQLVSIVNPLRTKPSESCAYYRSDQPQVFARGFKAMQQAMLPRQYDKFMSRLKERFGRTGYFERRRGDRLCSPADVAAVRQALQELGLPQLEFDAYEQHINWKD